MTTPVIVLLARADRAGPGRGEVDPDVNPINSAVFFLLGLYALAITTNDCRARAAMLDDYVEDAAQLRQLARIDAVHYRVMT